MPDELAFRDTGRPSEPDAATLLFVHGYGCDQSDWVAQMAGLAPFFRCIALDLPGHGDSAVPEDVSIPAMADAVNRMRARLELDRVVLVGHSMGAKVVREVHARQPEGICGAILVEGSLYRGDKADLLARAAAKLETGDLGQFTRSLFADMFPEGSDPALVGRLLERAAALDRGFARALFLATVGWDPDRGVITLQGLNVPVLVMQSTRFDADFIRRPIPPGETAEFVETVCNAAPDPHVAILPDCGHFPMFDAPLAVNRRIIEFTRRCVGQPVVQVREE
ncbi:alpha/beta hydrolase [Paracoccus sp. (in: a-proteobacteria)]|uniref:alpha/beta fold hydrolase n=1 Tax=Paracoccus sp. TaxID=267 RepID=UPI002AFE1562|nr:alpha/beta hydrolase [Paracoccus sp. (in: a-proteobacteria)]